MGGSRLLEEGGVEGLHVGVHSDWETSDDIEMCPVSSTTEFVAETLLPTRHGKLRLRGYRHSVGLVLLDVKFVGKSKHDVCTALALHSTYKV